MLKAESRLLFSRHNDLSRFDAREFILQLLGRRKLGNLEIAGGEVDQCEAKFTRIGTDGGDEIIPVGVEDVGVKMCAGSQNLGDLALNELTGLGVPELVTDRNFLAEPEQFADVPFGGVVREAAHWGAVAGSQGEI